MYDKDISRTDPGCIVFLLDRSDSMKQQWGSSQETLAEGAARALNEILLEVCFRSQGEPGKARHYFDIGIFGYGMRPVAGGEGVESAFGGALAGRPMVGLPELRDKPIAVREVPSSDLGAPPSRVPVWVEPVSGFRTPMCQAMAVAGGHIHDWVTAHPASFVGLASGAYGAWTLIRAARRAPDRRHSKEAAASRDRGGHTGGQRLRQSRVRRPRS